MRAPVTVLATCLLLVALAPAATAATTQAGSGSSRLSLEGKGQRDLRALGVSMSAAKPVRVSRTTLVLPVATGALASTARFDSKGALVLRKGRRKLSLTAPQVKLAKKGSVTVNAGKRRITLFTITPAKGKAMRINAATGRTTLQSAKVAMPASTGRRIRKALRLKRTPSGAFGTITVIATVKPAATTLPGGTPVAKPLAASEPPVLARPQTAVDVTNPSIDWNVRESFVRYMNTESEPATSNGAAPLGPKEVRPESSVPLQYRYTYAPVSGWWDPASNTAALYFRGTINWRFAGHGIDFDTKDPEIEINGGASRAIFRLDGRGKTPYGNKRGVLLDLAPTTTAAAPCSTAGNVVRCTAIPAKVPADAGSSVFAGFYTAGDRFGDISVSFTKP